MKFYINAVKSTEKDIKGYYPQKSNIPEVYNFFYFHGKKANVVAKVVFYFNFKYNTWIHIIYL